MAAGFLLNSSENPFPGNVEHHGTGIVFRRNLAPALRKVYQGSSRWCGALFLAKPIPLLILSVYAPTAATNPEIKEKFYQEIGEIIAENGGAMVILLGDFNARILANPGLPRHIGTNIFSSAHPLGTHSEEVLDNRERFLDFLVQHDMVALNTLQGGPPETQITYRYPGQANFEPPWEEARFTQIDFILTKSRWRNLFSEVRARPNLDFDSDHLPISAELHAHWHFGSPPKTPPNTKHNRTCTIEQKGAYNKDIKQHPFSWDNIRESITASAKKNRGTRPPDIKKPYLKDTTIALLRQRDEALHRGHHAESKLLTTQFRHQVKKDRKDAITEQLRTFSGHQQNWPAIKKLRKAFIPRFSKRGTEKGSIPASFPNDCARFFATEHWKLLPPEPTTCPPPIHAMAHEEGRFSIEELNSAIDGLKPNKAGGPDEIIIELIKDFDDENRLRLLELYNDIYDQGNIPDHFNEALVVQIYKTGKTPELFSSYRPIALLNITYKILAKLIQHRLRETLDGRIVDFQYGFRQGRSTAEPIFIARRIQELAERHGLHLYFLALDYSKAFDSIPHEKLIECLIRIGAPQKMVELVQAIYTNPRFRIKIPEGTSDEFSQDIGIRQGCPLSPYLYIIATSCQMTDLLKDLRNTEIQPPTGATYPVLLFADDTLLITEKAAHMEQLLGLIIEHSTPYNLTLNKGKCQLLVTNDVGSRVNFPDGTAVTRQEQIKYLGATFNASLDVSTIVRQKTVEATATMRTLAPLWSDSHIPTPWKLVVYNAVIRSRVFYTLETLELTPGQQRILDTLYFRGLRRILKKRSTFIDRFWTNDRLVQLANAQQRRGSRGYP